MSFDFPVIQIITLFARLFGTDYWKKQRMRWPIDLPILEIIDFFSLDITAYVIQSQLPVQLADLIKKGSVKVGDVSEVLCQDLSNHCSKTR